MWGKKTPVGGRTPSVAGTSHLVTASGDVEGRFCRFLCRPQGCGRRDGTPLSESVSGLSPAPFSAEAVKESRSDLDL